MNSEQFQKILDSEYSLDDYEYKNLESNTKTKECPLCKKLFYPEGRNANRQRYCKRTHIINCIVCGKPVKQLQPSNRFGSLRITCSKESCHIIVLHEKRFISFSKHSTYREVHHSKYLFWQLWFLRILH